MTQQPMRQVVPAWTVGDRLRKARVAAGLEQVELAERIGVSRGSVLNYEADKTRQKKIVLRAWAMATGVPVEWIETGRHAGDNPPPTGPTFSSSTSYRPAVLRAA